MKKALHMSLEMVSLTTIVCCVMLCIGFSGTAAGQVDALFETTSVERQIATRLKLSRKDLRSLQPLIERENDDLLSLYGYYADDYSSDFLSLWNAVRSRQHDLESHPSAESSPRLMRALALARIKIESRILEQWLDDYLQTISDMLELNWVQRKYVYKIFDGEHNRRLEILRKETGRSAHLDDLWQRLTDERERKLETILDESQTRSYRQMTAPERLIAKNLQEKIEI